MRESKRFCGDSNCTYISDTDLNSTDSSTRWAAHLCQLIFYSKFKKDTGKLAFTVCVNTIRIWFFCVRKYDTYFACILFRSNDNIVSTHVWTHLWKKSKSWRFPRKIGREIRTPRCNCRLLNKMVNAIILATYIF